MKKIGQGWQYTVYDLGNGKVLKKFHSLIKAYFVIFREIFPFENDSFFNIPSFVRSMKRKAIVSFEILKKYNVPPELLANPILKNNYNYEQDKVVPLHEVFININTNEIKKIVDQFIELNKKLMSIGFIDKSFNFTKNYGLNNKGEVVLIDIGELLDDKDLINKQIKNRVWDKSYISGMIKNNEAREYFINEMDKNFNLN